MIFRLLYFFLLALVVRAVWKGLFERRAVSSPDGVERQPAVYKGLMVRDPVCGLHLPESRAIVEIHAGERKHFCSEKCRAEFQKARR